MRWRVWSKLLGRTLGVWICINHLLGHVPDPLKLPSTDIPMRISTRFEKNSYSCPVLWRSSSTNLSLKQTTNFSAQSSLVRLPLASLEKFGDTSAWGWVVWLPAQPVSAHRSAWGLQAQLHAQFASAHRLGLMCRFDLRCGFLPNFQLSEEEGEGWRESFTHSSFSFSWCPQTITVNQAAKE